jgi:mgtE-like transporter
MSLFDKDFEEIFTSQIVSMIGGVLVGTIIAVYTNQTLLIPGMLILLPGFLEMRGNISGSFASRLSSGLFLGVINPKRIKTHIIKGNLAGSFSQALIVSLILGLIVFLFNFFVLKIVMPKIILVPLFAAIIANAVEIPLTLSATLYFFKKGHDPNNIMGPFVTTVGDITSVLALLFALMVTV